MCFDTLSDELNMQTSRLPRRLMDYITYGFFESNKNKANQKVHPTQKKKRIHFQSVIKGIVPPVSSVCWLNVCTAQVGGALVWSHLGSKVKADFFEDSEQVPVLNAKIHFL